MKKHISQAPGVFAVAALLLSPYSAWAQAKPGAPDPIIRLTIREASSFTSAFTALSRQAHVTVVAEDQPLHPTLTGAPLSPTPTRQVAPPLALKKDGEPLSTLLPKLAAAYDYDVQPSGKTFLLKKRYTNAGDLPSITLRECALGLEEAARYADLFDPHFPNGDLADTPAMRDLFYAVPPAQDVPGDAGAVPAAALTPDRQQELGQFLLHFYVQRAVRGLPDAVAFLNRAAVADPHFGWHQDETLHVPLFGYDALDSGGRFRALLKSDMRIVQKVGEPAMTQTALLFESDPTAPAPAPANAPKPIPPVSSSLAEILARLNARAADGLKDNGLKVSVEPYLAPKRATVFGEEAATPRQEVDALADMYGLRVFTGEKEGGHDRLRLTRRTAQVPLNVLALHSSILQSLPEPLVRACLVQGGFSDPNRSQLMVSAVKQIREAVEPRVRGTKNGRVALSALSEREGRAFASLMTLDSMQSLHEWLQRDPPEEFTRFNELWVKTVLSEQGGKRKLNFWVMLPGVNGSSHLLPGLGVGNIDYDPMNHTL